MTEDATRSREDAGSLLIEYAHPPLTCYLVDCDQRWHAELMRKLDTNQQTRNVGIRTTELLLDETQQGRGLVAIPAGCTVVWQLADRWLAEQADLAVIFQQIHDWNLARISVQLILPRVEPTISQAFRIAGAGNVVTELLECDKLARFIGQANRYRPTVLTSWRTRFVNRLPWKAV